MRNSCVINHHSMVSMSVKANVSELVFSYFITICLKAFQCFSMNDRRIKCIRHLKAD